MRNRKLLSVLVLSLMFSLLCPLCVCANETQEKYEAVIVDEPDYLSINHEKALMEEMQKLTDTCNIVAYIIDENGDRSTEHDTINYVKSWYFDTFGIENGIVVAIDMTTRYVEIVNFEENVDRIGNYRASLIADNVYHYASNQLYYDCFGIAIKQIGYVITGVSIPQKMKTITNIFLAMVIALIINFYLLKYLSRSHNVRATEYIKSAKVNLQITPGESRVTGSRNVSYDLGSIEGVIYTKNIFGKLIHLAVFILVCLVEAVLNSGSSSGGSSGGSRSSGGHSSGGHSGGGGHKF